MRRTTVVLAVACLAGSLALAGCKQKPRYEVPEYPTSQRTAAPPPEELEGGVVEHMTRVTSDPVPMVAAWFRQALPPDQGWSEGKELGPTFSDGNLAVEWKFAGAGKATVTDPTLPGAKILVHASTQGTYVRYWVYRPRK